MVSNMAHQLSHQGICLRAPFRFQPHLFLFATFVFTMPLRNNINLVLCTFTDNLFQSNRNNRFFRLVIYIRFNLFNVFSCPKNISIVHGNFNIWTFYNVIDRVHRINSLGSNTDRWCTPQAMSKFPEQWLRNFTNCRPSHK